MKIIKFIRFKDRNIQKISDSFWKHKNLFQECAPFYIKICPFVSKIFVDK